MKRLVILAAIAALFVLSALPASANDAPIRTTIEITNPTAVHPCTGETIEINIVFENALVHEFTDGSGQEHLVIHFGSGTVTSPDVNIEGQPVDNLVVQPGGGGIDVVTDARITIDGEPVHAVVHFNNNGQNVNLQLHCVG